MKKIEVQIKEKDKGTKVLSLLNLRDELVNFLYKDTVANATKADLQFFVLLFFVAIKVSDRTLLEHVFDDAMPKFKKLNKAFSEKKNQLRAKEYNTLVKEYGLTDFFKNDVFFVLVEAILNIQEIEEKFSDYIADHAEIRTNIAKIKLEYLNQLTVGMEDFASSKIEDDRYDENGNYHDLSKSVYRTVRMRNSRNLDLSLQKYTSIKEITSRSPIDLTFFQHIDPQIIFDLWDKFHLAQYLYSAVPQVVTAIKNHVDFHVHLGDLVPMWLFWKWTNPNDRKKKNEARQDFERAKLKPDTHKEVDELNSILVKSVLNANERLEEEVDKNRKLLKKISTSSVKDKDRIKKLEERIKQLENVSIKAEIVEEDH